MDGFLFCGGQVFDPYACKGSRTNRRFANRQHQGHAHTYTALSQSIMVMCGYYDFPSPRQDPEEVFDETRDGSIRSVHGTLLTEVRLARDGYSGRRFRSTGLGNAFVDEEMYLVGQRFYLITITTSTKTPNANIKKVFDSFHFTTSQ